MENQELIECIENQTNILEDNSRYIAHLLEKILQDLNKLRENEIKEKKWINIKDKLPPKDIPVLCLLKKGLQQVLVCRKNEFDEIEYKPHIPYDPAWCKYNLIKEEYLVSHWMLLPELSKIC